MLEAFETAMNKITRTTFYITYKAVGRINFLVSVKKKNQHQQNTYNNCWIESPPTWRTLNWFCGWSCIAKSWNMKRKNYKYLLVFSRINRHKQAGIVYANHRWNLRPLQVTKDTFHVTINATCLILSQPRKGSIYEVSAIVALRESEMASKRKFNGDTSQALVPVKKQKQHQVALLNHEGVIQEVWFNLVHFVDCFDVLHICLDGNVIVCFIDVKYLLWCFASSLKEPPVSMRLLCCLVDMRWVIIIHKLSYFFLNGHGNFPYHNGRL